MQATQDLIAEHNAVLVALPRRRRSSSPNSRGAV